MSSCWCSLIHPESPPFLRSMMALLESSKAFQPDTHLPSCRCEPGLMPFLAGGISNKENDRINWIDEVPPEKMSINGQVFCLQLKTCKTPAFNLWLMVDRMQSAPGSVLQRDGWASFSTMPAKTTGQVAHGSHGFIGSCILPLLFSASRTYGAVFLLMIRPCGAAQHNGGSPWDGL